MVPAPHGKYLLDPCGRSGTVRRRALLAALAGTSASSGAGCLTDGTNDDGSGGDGSDDDGREPTGCTAVAIESASVRVAHVCDYGPTTDAEVVGSAPDCTDALAVELVDGDVVVEQRSVEPGNEWTARFELDAPVDPGEAAIRVRGAGDAIVAERTVAVEHYRDAPHLSIWSPSVDPETATVGEPVDVTLTLGNVGGSGEFTAEFRVDGEVVGRREGTVPGATDCDSASGPELSLSYAFEEPGEYGVAVALRTAGPGGTGGDVDVGTVTVGE